MWVIGDPPRPPYLPWAQCNGEPGASLALCRYATCNIHDWPGKRERRGLEGKGSRGRGGVRPTDRWFPSWSDAQTSNQLSLDPSLPSTEMSKIASKFFTMATNRRLSRPFSSSGRTENEFWGRYHIDVTSKKGLVVEAASFWDGWLVASLCSPKPQPDISTFDCRCNELIRPLTNWRLRCR